ncbi:aspartate kinase [Dongshaea marina]|uniref:aspartate kinase n=1 Tax=Dongshaea marina TaxID=2047966 RepID=UPI002277F140|nr:aspartate kinase [Dongshaea marina]
MALQQQGLKAISFTAPQLNIRTQGAYNNAHIESVDNRKITQALDEGYVVIVAGFQGINETGCITTLGRGGSDTTAVALAAALNLEEVDIYTDVDGVYSGDPRIIPSAFKHRELSFELMLELARQGARVLHSRCVKMAQSHKVHIHLRSSFTRGEGTRIHDKHGNIPAGITGVTALNRVAKIVLSAERGALDQPLDQLNTCGVELELISRVADEGNLEKITAVAPQSQLPHMLKILERCAISPKQYQVETELAKLSLVGAALHTHPTAHKLYELLHQEQIPSLPLSSSELNVSCLISADKLTRAQQTLHQKLVESTVCAA